MSQNKINELKHRITEQQLQRRFEQADLNGDGQLSAEEITTLLQSLGYQDTYKGTIKKICRKMQRLSLLQKQMPNSETKQKIQPKNNNQSSQNQGEKTDRQIETKTQEEPTITFYQFKQYFQILQNPVSKEIYNSQLAMKVFIRQLSAKMHQKKVFPKDKGQKLHLNILVGQQKLKYNSFIEINISKQPFNKNKYDSVFAQIIAQASSPQNAELLSKQLLGIYNQFSHALIAEQQLPDEILEMIKLDASVQDNRAKLKFSTADQTLIDFIKDYIKAGDQILGTQIVCKLKLLISFDFQISNLKNDPLAVIEDIVTKDCNINLDFKGSQIMDLIKQLALIMNVWQILKVDPEDILWLSLLSAFCMEKADLQFKMKNLQKTQISRGMTQFILQSIQQIAQVQSQTFSLRKISQLISGPIIIKIHVASTTINVNINVKDILKLPFLRENQPEDGAQSD